MIFWENNDDVTFLDISWLILSLFLPHRARIFLLNHLGLFLHQSECQKAGFGAQIGINMKFFWDKYQDVRHIFTHLLADFSIVSPTFGKDLSLKSFSIVSSSIRMPKSWVWSTNGIKMKIFWDKYYDGHHIFLLCQKLP